MREQMKKNYNLHVGAALICLLALLMLVSLVYIPYDYNRMDTAASFLPPSFAHPLGTDNFGRDIFSRVAKGSQTTFFVGFFAVCVGLVLGLLLGAVAGYFSGLADEAIMRLTDAQMAFPGVILALVFIAVLGPGVFHTAIALGIMAVPRFCRITRAGFMQIREMEYVKAARARGASHLRLMALHILPNMLSQLLVTASLGFSSAVLAEAGLSYLGLGIQPPEPSWGKMLYEAQSYLLTHPLYAVVPGAMITMMVLGFNLLGDGIRDLSEKRG